MFKHLWDVDLKIRHSKYEFFKFQVHYLCFLVGTRGVQLLPEKVTVIQALEPPKDINKLMQFLGLVGFYRKFIPFFADVMACLNTMLRTGAVFKWTEQRGNAFRLLKSELVKIPRLQYPNPNKPFMLFTDTSKHSYSDVDFSYCWLNLEVSWYSLEQYIGCIIRQAFNYHCSLLQVWREPENQALIWDLEAKEV